jgi:hypothetical protein
MWLASGFGRFTFGKTLPVLLDRRLSGTKAGLDNLEKGRISCPAGNLTPNLSVHSLIAVRLQTQNNLVITTSVYMTLRL